jgi:hypothetical protein
MRGQTLATAALIATMAGHAALAVRSHGDPKADEVMAAARKALGGEKKIASVKGLALRADYRREVSGDAAMAGGGGGGTFIMMGPGGGGTPAGPQQLTGKIEIDVALPDKYLRSDIGVSGFALTRTDGFEGTRPFVEVIPGNPGMRVQVDNPATDPARAKAALKRSHGDLARLMLGLVADTQPSFSATYTYTGQAESPDGKADVIDVTGPEDFKARLFIDTTTHLPLMLTYMDAEPRVVTRSMTRDAGGGGQHGGTPATAVAGGGTGGGGTPAGASPANTPPSQLTPEQREQLDKQVREAEATPPKMIEYRMFFSEYREVDGLMLPFRIARGRADKTTEEWDVKSYKLNPSIKADRFKVGS